MFILEPGKWVGEGQITFSVTNQSVNYRTVWTIHPEHKGAILAQQMVYLEGVEEPTRNFYKFSRQQGESFSVIMENPLFGDVSGQATLNEELFEFEIAHSNEFFGKESYRSLPENCFEVSATYTSEEKETTQIRGLLRRAP